MSLSNEVVLRPRFNFDVYQNNFILLKLFEVAKTAQSDIVVSLVDDNVYLRIPKNQQHYWSPQLHLEIMRVDKNKSKLFGVFGPNPTVWTMFMFFHFIIAGLFIGFGIWTYTNWSLDNNYTIQLFLTLLTIVIWFILYFAGRLGKKAGMSEMYQLHRFMRDTLRSQDTRSEE